MTARSLFLVLALGAIGSVACGAATGTYGPAPALAPQSGAVVHSTTDRAVAGPLTVSGAAPTGGQPSTTGSTALTLPAGSRLELTSAIAVRLKSNGFDAALGGLQAFVAAQRGYLATSSTDSPAEGDHVRGGTFSFQVPSAGYQATIDYVRGLGTVQSLTTSTKNHSADYVDLTARLKSAEAQRDAMLALYQRAQSVQDIIAVRQQLGQYQSEVEQLQGQIDYIDSLTTFSTVTVTMREGPIAVTPPPSDDLGLRAALSLAFHNFVAVVDGFIVFAGSALPFLIILAALAFAFRRRLRGVFTPAADPAPSA